MPNVPEHVHDDSPEAISRRKFLSNISYAMSGGIAVLVGLPVVGFVLEPFWKKVQTEWIAVGKVDSFRIGETVHIVFKDPTPLPWAGVTAQTAAWLRRRSATEFIAFAVNCTHLGCPVRWLADAGLFMCPCHGGVYYSNGEVASGPPPLPLPRYQVRINQDQVEIQTMPVPITPFS